MNKTTFRVTTSNGHFWQTHDVLADTEDGARAMAEDAANDPTVLADEARDAAAIGEAPGGKYVACKCVPWSVVLDDDDVRFVDSGGEG